MCVEKSNSARPPLSPATTFPSLDWHYGLGFVCGFKVDTENSLLWLFLGAVEDICYVTQFTISSFGGSMGNFSYWPWYQKGCFSLIHNLFFVL